MNGRKIVNIDIKYDYGIHRYRHSKSAIKAKRHDKKTARHLDRIQNQSIIRSEKMEALA